MTYRHPHDLIREWTAANERARRAYYGEGPTTTKCRRCGTSHDQHQTLCRPCAIKNSERQRAYRKRKKT